MTHDELVEKVASHFEFPDKETTLVTAENILNEILAALQEPTEEMCKTSMLTTKEVKIYWPQLLAASPLGEQSE